MDFRCWSEYSDGEVESGRCVSGKDELCDEGKEGGGGCTNLEDEFTEACIVDLCDVERFLVRLFEQVSNGWIVGDELKWNC